MKQTNKIALVVAYFGRFPNYYPLWVKSCSYNPTIDFWIFTDQIIEDLPANVKCVKMTLLEMKNRATKVLGFEAALSRPYKCCDYRPLYGLMFADFLQQYDYWGHCDIDLIFGDLQKFFNDNNLYNYEKFGMLGHLSLFKNNEKVNKAYMISNNHMNYRDVYTNEKNMFFDELCGISTIMKESRFKVFTKRIFVDIATMYHRYRIIDVYPLDNKPKNYKFQTFYWERGKTYHVYLKDGIICKDEYLYIHFQKRPNYQINPLLLSAKSFFITNTGFLAGSLETMVKEDFQKLNPYFGYIYELIEDIINSYKSRIQGYIRRKLDK